MSYDLYFYKKKESPITENDIAEYLNDKLVFSKREHPKQWDNENPETGVYFLVDWNEPNIDQEDIEMFDSFVDYTNLNFSCSINFFRPNYFGFEIFPIIEKLIGDLDLYVIDPQDDVNSEMPQKFPVGYLQDQWIRHNRQLIKENFEKMNFKYMPIEKSNDLWAYQFIRNELQDNLEEDIFVAGIFVLESKTDEKLYTVCVWPKHIPIIIPKVDYIIIQKNYKKLFRNIEENGLVTYDEIMGKLGYAFTDFDHPIKGAKLLNQENSNKIGSKFNSLKILQNAPDFGSLIRLDNFINYLPE